jgi:hypothetical protein
VPLRPGAGWRDAGARKGEQGIAATSAVARQAIISASIALADWHSTTNRVAAAEVIHLFRRMAGQTRGRSMFNGYQAIEDLDAYFGSRWCAQIEACRDLIRNARNDNEQWFRPETPELA